MVCDSTNVFVDGVAGSEGEVRVARAMSTMYAVTSSEISTVPTASAPAAAKAASTFDTLKRPRSGELSSATPSGECNVKREPESSVRSAWRTLAPSGRCQ